MLSKVHPAGQSGFQDRYDVKASAWFQAWDGQAEFDIGLLAAPLSKTSISHSGAAQFPQSVRAAMSSYGTYHLDLDVDLSEHLRAVDLGDVEMHVTDLQRCQRNIGEAIEAYWRTCPKTTLFLVGGDHSITAPSLTALRKVVANRPIGVIHFDAHHDMRNLEDGGPTNGTPFRTLLDSGVLEGHRMVQIGLRNFSNAKAYSEYARLHGVQLVSARQAAETGIRETVEQAWKTVSRDDAMVYVSFDLDVLDQAFAPGVPAPGPGGIHIWDALWAMERLGTESQVVAFDWVCADPTVDVRNLTSRVAANLILSAAAGMTSRKK